MNDKADTRLFKKVIASLIDESLKILEDMWQVCKDPRTPEEILDGKANSTNGIPTCGWSEFMEKHHLLKHYLDRTKRFCDDSIDNGKGLRL
jgi:hypothetical protein